MKDPKGSNLTAPSSQAHQRPFIRVYEGDSFVRNFKIEPGKWVVGRDASADLKLDGKTISRRHFQIEYEGENRLYIQDLQSANGTLVNGDKITRAPLAHGDEIQMGEFTMVISHKASAQANVIPFPQIKTDPKIQIPAGPVKAAEAPPPKIKKIGFVFRTLQMMILSAIAAGTAYEFNQYWIGKKKVMQVVPPKVVVAKKVEPTPVLPTVVPTVAPETAEEEVVEESVNEVQKKADEPKTDLAATLKKSLGGIGVEDLKGAAAKVKSNDSKSESNLAELKRMQKDGFSVDIDIQMPKPEELEKAFQKSADAEKQRQAMKNFNPQNYRDMLRKKVEGVDTCYYQNIKSGEAGKVSVSFSIAKSGNIQKVNIESSSFENAGLKKCVIDKISSLKMDPPPYDGFTVVYGFRFGARQVRF